MKRQEKLEAQQARRDAIQDDTVERSRHEKVVQEVNELRSENDELKKNIAHLKYKLTCLGSSSTAPYMSSISISDACATSLKVFSNIDCASVD